MRWGFSPSGSEMSKVVIIDLLQETEVLRDDELQEDLRLS